MPALLRNISYNSVLRQLGVAVTELFGLDKDRVWDTELAFRQLQSVGQADTKRTAERRLHEFGVLPDELGPAGVKDELGRPANRLVVGWALESARGKRKLPLFVQLHDLPSGTNCLHANDARGARYWIPLKTTDTGAIVNALQQLQQHVGKDVAVFPHGDLAGRLRDVPSTQEIMLFPAAYPPVLKEEAVSTPRRTIRNAQLRRLEAESIHILREAAAEADNPVMLYSAGKDSSVMLHLARKAFFPAPPPFPLMHVDTRWEFQEIYLFRDRMAQMSGMDLLVHVNPEAIAKDINPFDHGSALHTDVTKTEGLRQALDKYGFDVAFGGARRDEERSCAKERIFSLRTQMQLWDPQRQRPELWNLYNAKKNRGEGMRVFPLSNWTELDVWEYIDQEKLPVVSLYFAKMRPVVVRDDAILLVDDDRLHLLPGEKIVEKCVRFRTLGCYPLTAAIESHAGSVPEIIQELLTVRYSERQGRVVDNDVASSMERKKQKGYF